MESVKSNKMDLGLLLLRAGAGLMMAFGHGLPKIEKYATLKETFPDPVGLGPHISVLLAIFAEFFCALLVVAGFKTRLAALPVFFTMMVAGLIQHAGDPFKKMEPALIYALIFLLFTLGGAGGYSVDRIFSRKNG